MTDLLTTTTPRHLPRRQMQYNNHVHGFMAHVVTITNATFHILISTTGCRGADHSSTAVDTQFWIRPLYGESLETTRQAESVSWSLDVNPVV